MVAFLTVLYRILDLYSWVIIIAALLSWLVAFGVVNNRNRIVLAVIDFCDRLTEPALRPIRRVLPLISGIDLSPIALLFLIMFLQQLIIEYLPRVQVMP